MEMGGEIQKAEPAPKLHLTADHLLTDILIDAGKEPGGKEEAALSLHRAGIIQLSLSGVRKKLNRLYNHKRSGGVYQLHHRRCPLNSAESHPTRKGCKVGGGSQVIFSWMLSLGGL